MRRLAEEAEGGHRWSNPPGDRYPVHTHPYDKILYCVEGSITFELPGRSWNLEPGDRIEVPAGTPHSAVVGPHGVACIEGRRRPGSTPSGAR